MAPFCGPPGQMVLWLKRSVSWGTEIYQNPAQLRAILINNETEVLISGLIIACSTLTESLAQPTNLIKMLKELLSHSN